MEVVKVVFMLMAQDMERAISFYQDVIGLPLKLNVGGWVELGRDDAVVALHAGGDGKPRSTGLGFTVTDIAAACEEVCAAGGSINHPPEARPGEGIILAVAVDTEGNSFNLTQNLPL